MTLACALRQKSSILKRKNKLKGQAGAIILLQRMIDGAAQASYGKRVTQAMLKYSIEGQ